MAGKKRASAASSVTPSAPARPWLARRWVQAVLVLMLSACVMALAGMASAWVVTRPMFDIRSLRFEGDLSRNTPAELGSALQPHLHGNFFMLNLQEVREEVESVAWVRKAVVRRIWPNRLVIKIEEHQPLAVWREQGLPDRLVSRLGDVFEANLGDVDNLPEFEGGRGQAPRVMAMFAQLSNRLLPLESPPVRLALSPRGSWEVELRRGEVIALGRGSDEQVLERVDRFVRSISRLNLRLPGRRWDRADLRHANGFSLHLAASPAVPVKRAR